MINRRKFLQTLPAAAALPRLVMQSAKPTIPVAAMNHFALRVSDVQRSVDFYQGLFGMPIQTRQDTMVFLRIGSGPQFMAIAPMNPGGQPDIVPAMGLRVPNFNTDRLVGILAQHGITKAEPSDPGLSGGPMKVRVRVRNGTQELFFGDPDGMVLQLHDPAYCGGPGPLGNMCGNVEPSPKKGLIAVKDLSHFTINSPDGNRSNKFYQDLFGLPVRSRQGAAVGLGIGPGVMFVMFAGGGGARGGANAAPRPASVNHVCMNMENFKPGEVLKTLSSYGITARGDAQGAGPAGPLKHYVTLRMPNRGGAPEGTPELYFTDPDGLLIQLQDVSYCGGAGFLGNVCEG